MPVLFVPTYYQPQDNNGALLPGGKVFTYAAGTTTPKATFTDAGGTVQAANPVILDAGGKATIWLDGSYKFIVTSADGSFTVTTDNVTSFVQGGSGSIDINGLTSTSPDYADTVPVYDVSATGNRKISLSSLLGLLPSYISGFMPQGVGGTSTTANLTITLGMASASNTLDVLQSPNLSWAVTNGNNINGYQGGTTLPNSSTIHFFICKGATGIGSFASLSLTPTLPAGYDLAYRRVFSLITNATGVLSPVISIETEGGSLVTYLVTATNDFSATVSTTSNLITLGVPLGIKLQHVGRYWQPTGGGVVSAVILTSPDETDGPPSSVGTAAANSLGYDTASTANFNGAASSSPLITNTAGQIRARASAATNYSIVTRGWKDFRR